ncbi:hypothetical protein AeNC1_016918 [Aphanomyces euteiches]|nr:hypothetical protein AeNC1_016918 [Aphanomyces euteiches]
MMDMDCEYREQESLDDGHGLRIPRRISQPHREIIIFQSILQDDVIPIEAPCVGNESSWIVIEKIDSAMQDGSSPNSLSFKYFGRATAPVMPKTDASEDDKPAIDPKVILDALLTGVAHNMQSIEQTIMQFV